MEAGEWEPEFSEARQRLLESRDFDALCGHGHLLTNGVVLTSVSDLPFEMSLKCIRCGTVFWFENAAWSTGGPVQWHISNTSLQQASVPCPCTSTDFINGQLTVFELPVGNSNTLVDRATERRR